MSWVKYCDRTFARKRSARAGVTAMGFWGALMCHAAHLESDGWVDAEDIEHAWLYGFEPDVELWADQFEAAAEELDVTPAERMAFVAMLRRAKRRVAKNPDRVRQALVKHLCDEAKLLKRPRGRGHRYALEHPDREPFLTHQLSREQNQLLRQRNREKQRARRERLKAEELALERGLTVEQALAMLHEDGLSPGDYPGTSPRLRERGAPPPPRDAAPGGEAPTADLENEAFDASSPNFVTPSRPLGGEDSKEHLLPLEVREIHASLLAERPLKPLAKDWNLSLALYRLQKHLRVGVGAILTAIRETAVEASVRLATGAIRNPQAWITETLVQRCRDSSNAKASEADHRALTRHEKRSPQQTRALAYERQFQQDDDVETRRQTLRDQLAQLEVNLVGAAGVAAALT